MDLASQFLQEHVGELGHVGLHIITLSVKDLEPKHFAYLDGLPEHFRSWSHVDHLSLGVMQPLLWRYRKETLELLEEWSRSPIRWKRRASVVTFVRKVAESGEFTEEVISLCENLIWGDKRQPAISTGSHIFIHQRSAAEGSVFDDNALRNSRFKRSEASGSFGGEEENGSNHLVDWKVK